MKARLEALSPRALIALAIVVVIFYSLVVWFLMVSPKRSEAARLDADIAAAEVRLAQAQVTGNRPQRGRTPVADVFRLAKAMPATADQPGLVLELDRLARSSGVTLSSITPAESVIGAGGATMIPVTVVIDGSYRKITRFLSNTRHLVTLRGGKLRTTGRLFTVQSVELAESNTHGFPLLDGTITLNAFVYDGPIVPPSAPTPAAESSTPGTSASGATP